MMERISEKDIGAKPIFNETITIKNKAMTSTVILSFQRFERFEYADSILLWLLARLSLKN